MWAERSQHLLSPADIGEAIGDHVPELDAVMEAVADEVSAFQGILHASAKVPSAVLTAATQAANDLLDLLYDVSYGRGRPALRTTRGLIELAITMADITSDPDLAERYARHEYVTAIQFADTSAGLTHLRGNDLKGERHRRKKLRASAASGQAAAIKDYGPGFQRAWSPENLYERARRHGLDGLYEFYRISSAGTHASAGGLFGLGVDINDVRTHRIGAPDLSMVAVALDQGVLAYRTLIERLRDAYGLQPDRLLRALDGLDAQYPALRKAMLAIEKEITPDTPTPKPTVIRVVHTDGRRQWMLHDVARGLVIACDVPDASRENLEAVEASVDEGERVVPQPRRHLLAVGFIGAEARPLPGAKWYSDRMLVPFEEPVIVADRQR